MFSRTGLAPSRLPPAPPPLMIDSGSENMVDDANVDTSTARNSGSRPPAWGAYAYQSKGLPHTPQMYQPLSFVIGVKLR
jgi:hypothetical protein